MVRLLPPVTPGEVLREEFMAPLGLSANRLAEALGLPANRISAILNGTPSITADIALRLARCFRSSAEFSLNLQLLRDLEVARRASDKTLAKTVKPLSRKAA